MRRTRMLSILLAVLLVFSFSAAALAAEPMTVTVETKTDAVSAGNEVTLAVSIAGNPGFTNYQWTLEYDADSLELKNVENKLGGLLRTREEEGKAFLGLINDQPIAEDGTALLVTFVVKQNAAEGLSEVKISSKKLASLDKTVDAQYVAGGVTIADSTGGTGSTTGGTGSTTGGTGSTTGGTGSTTGGTGSTTGGTGSTTGGTGSTTGGTGSTTGGTGSTTGGTGSTTGGTGSTTGGTGSTTGGTGSTTGGTGSTTGGTGSTTGGTGSTTGGTGSTTGGTGSTTGGTGSTTGGTGSTTGGTGSTTGGTGSTTGGTGSTTGGTGSTTGGTGSTTGGTGSTTGSDRKVERVGKSNNATHTVTGNTLNVQNDVACVVLWTDDGGKTYTKLAATANEAGGYDFDLTNVPANAVIKIAIKGDVTGDGLVTSRDALAASRIAAGNITCTKLQEVVGNVLNLDDFSSRNALAISRSAAGNLTLTW